MYGERKKSKSWPVWPPYKFFDFVHIDIVWLRLLCYYNYIAYVTEQMV